MSRCPTCKRVGLAIALTLPVMVIFTSGMLHAQKTIFPRPPQIKQPPIMQPPIMQQPKMNQKIWKCSGCGGYLGNGPLPWANCPTCKAKIGNGMGGPVNAPVNNPPVINNPPVVVKNPPVNNNPPPIDNNPLIDDGGVNGGFAGNGGGGGVTGSPTTNKDSGGLSTGALVGSIVAGIVSLIGAGSMVFAGIMWFSSGSSSASPKLPRRREDV